MSLLSIARPHLSWVVLVVTTAAVSACGGSSGDSPIAPVAVGAGSDTSTVIQEGNNVPDGTLSDGSSQPEGEGNLPQGQGQEPSLGSAVSIDPNAEDLNDVAADLRRRFMDDARLALVGINTDYVSGTLDQSKFFCFNDDYPVTDYFCGGDDVAVFLTAYGSELVGFTYANTEACTGLLAAQGMADDCILEYTEIHYGELWNAVYRLQEVDFEFFEVVRVSDRTADFGSDACEITYGTASETFYSDEAVCDRILRSLATEASGF